VKKCARLCGFSVEEVALAKQRKFDEHFFLENPRDLAEVEMFFADQGLSLIRGGRFFHLKRESCN
jgi:predicted mannosyl-3-phosphoglycerate phosphatase (HAD superfamily)